MPESKLAGMLGDAGGATVPGKGDVKVAPDTVELTQQQPREALHLRPSLERALGLGGRPVLRLGSAGTSVRFVVGGDVGGAVTLLLDRFPPVVVNGGEPAEITIELDVGQAELFVGGRLVLPNCLLRGEVGCRGPVRKYLGFDPILRALLGRANGGSS